MKKKASILDYPHPGLDTSVWDSEGKLLPKHKETILKNIEKFLVDVGFPEYKNWIKQFRLIGSMTTYQYTSSSDIDVHLIVDLPKFIKQEHPELSEQEAHDFLDDLRKQCALTEMFLPGTKHPIEYYFETPFVNKEGTPGSGLYDIEKDEWVKPPVSVKQDFDIEEQKPQWIEDAKAIAAELDASFGSIKQNILRIEELQETMNAWEPEKRKLFQDKLNKKVEELDAEVNTLVKLRNKIVEHRRNYSPNSEQEIKFKYLQKFGYLWILSQFKDLLDCHKEVGEENVQEVKDIISEAAMEKEAYLEHAYWIDPKGKVYTVRDAGTNVDQTHSGWVEENAEFLQEKYEIDATGDSWETVEYMIELGWVRIGDSMNSQGYNTHSITVNDLRKIPSKVDDVVFKFYKEGDSLEVTDMHNNFVMIDSPFPDIQRAVIRKLREGGIQNSRVDDEGENPDEIIPDQYKQQNNQGPSAPAPKKRAPRKKKPEPITQNPQLELPLAASRRLSKNDKKAASWPEAFWLDPKGQLYPVDRTHDEWVVMQAPMLKQKYGLDLKQAFGDSLSDSSDLIVDHLILIGWTRGAASIAGREYIGNVANLRSVPSAAIDFFMQAPTPKVVFEDLNGKSVIVETKELVGGQKAINQALRLSRQSDFSPSIATPAPTNPATNEIEIPVDPDPVSDEETYYNPIVDKPRKLWEWLISLFSTKKEANSMENEYWISSDGQLHEATDGHERWILDNLGLIEDLGIDTYSLNEGSADFYEEQSDEYEQSLDHVWTELMKKGWSRIGQTTLRSDKGFYIEVYDLGRIPSYLDNYIAQWFDASAEPIIRVSDRKTDELIEVTEPFPTLQKAINRARNTRKVADWQTPVSPTNNNKMDWYWAESVESYVNETLPDMVSSWLELDPTQFDTSVIITSIYADEGGVTAEVHVDIMEPITGVKAAFMKLRINAIINGDVSHEPEGQEFYDWLEDFEMDLLEYGKKGEPPIKLKATPKKQDLEPFKPLPTTFEWSTNDKNLNWRYPWKFMKRPTGPDHSNMGEFQVLLHNKEAAASWAEEALQLALKNGGSTWNLSKGNMVGTNSYAVAIYPDRSIILTRQPTAEEIEAYAKENSDVLSGDGSIGIWHDGSSGKFYIDVVATVEDRDEAIELGKQHNQIAIFDLKKLEEIPTGGTGEKTAASIEEVNGIKVLYNPTPQEVRAFWKRSSNKALRGLIDPTNGDIYVWDAWQSEHEGMIRYFGLEISWEEDDGTFIRHVTSDADIDYLFEEAALHKKKVARKLSKKDTVEMPKDEFIKEHEHLLDVLKSPSHADDKKEYQKQKKELEEHTEKKADLDSKYWIAPDGKEFPVDDIHVDWIMRNPQILLQYSQYGLREEIEQLIELTGENGDWDLAEQLAGEIMSQMFKLGWVRVTTDDENGGYGISVDDIRKMPPSVDDFIARHDPDGMSIAIDDSENWVDIDEPFPSIQRAVNRALQRKRLQPAASLHKIAEDEGYWIDPNGKVFTVRDDNTDYQTHADWVSQNVDLLKNTYGLDINFNMQIREINNQLISSGWVRIGDSSSGAGVGMRVKNLRQIPPKAEEVLLSFYKGGPIAIEDLNGRMVELDNLDTDLQKAVNQALRVPAMARKAGYGDWNGWWMDPEGELHQLEENQEHIDWLDQNDRSKSIKDYLNEGWIRIRQAENSLAIHTSDPAFLNSPYLNDFLVKVPSHMIEVDIDGGLYVEVPYEEAIQDGLGKAYQKHKRRFQVAKLAAWMGEGWWISPTGEEHPIPPEQEHLFNLPDEVQLDADSDPTAIMQSMMSSGWVRARKMGGNEMVLDVADLTHIPDFLNDFLIKHPTKTIGIGDDNRWVQVDHENVIQFGIQKAIQKMMQKKKMASFSKDCWTCNKTFTTENRFAPRYCPTCTEKNRKWRQKERLKEQERLERRKPTPQFGTSFREEIEDPLTIPYDPHMTAGVYTDKEMEEIYVKQHEYNDSPGGGHVYHDWNQSTTDFPKPEDMEKTKVHLDRLMDPNYQKYPLNLPSYEVTWFFGQPAGDTN